MLLATVLTADQLQLMHEGPFWLRTQGVLELPIYLESHSEGTEKVCEIFQHPSKGALFLSYC